MTTKNVLMIIGGMHHPFKACGAIFKQFVEATERYTVTLTEDRDALRPNSIGEFDAVVVYTQGGTLTTEQSKGLTGFVKAGGAFVGLHSATASWKDDDAYVEMIGGVFAGHGRVMEFPVTLTDADSMITQRLTDFRIFDEFYTLERFDPRAVTVLATGMWRGEEHPMAYTKSYGDGRVFYLALGHDERAFNHPSFQKLALRGLDWTLGREPRKPLKAGVVGYGPLFNMGKLHLNGLRDGAGFEPVAVCDIVPERCAAAEADFPGISTYTDIKTMLKQSDAEIITLVTPHNTHAPLALECLKAGRHVVCEKPFCITVKEADAMIAAAKKKDLMLSVFHNRRWDGDYLTIRNAIANGYLGDVFQIEQCMGGYGHPGHWWRTHKPISGGAFYDWGAHVVDWVLGLVPSPVIEISGFFQQDKVWDDITNEEHCQAVLRFENGCSAFIEQSTVAAAGKPRWRILGTMGGLSDGGDQSFRLVSLRDGVRLDSHIAYQPSDWLAYYRNVGDHLILDEPLEVTPESARRVIAVIEGAEKSSRAGKVLKVSI